MIYNENGEILNEESSNDNRKMDDDIYIDTNPVRYNRITCGQWNKNKEFYKRAIKVLDSKCNVTIDKIEDDIKNSYKKKKLDIKVMIVYADNMLLRANDNCVELYIPLEIKNPKVDFKIKIVLKYNRDYEFKYSWYSTKSIL